MKHYAVIDNGVVINVVVAADDMDFTGWPHERVDVTDNPERVTLGYRYADGVFSAPPKRKEDFVAEASMKKGLMIANARYEVTELRTDLFLGDISDVDRKRLIAWRDHLRKLERIDVQAAPDIDWPAPPESGGQ